MARTSTTKHAFSKAGDASADQYNFTLDHTNLLDRLDAALAGVGAHAAGDNYVNTNANNAGKILSAVGGSYRGRVLGVSAADDASLIFQDNAGGTGTDKFALGYDDSLDAFVLSAGATLGNGLYMDASGNVLTKATNLGIRDHQIQMFILAFRNNGGVIEHRITESSGAALGNLAGRITGASATWTATGQSTGAFTAGVVLLTTVNWVAILNTPVMDANNCGGVCVVGYNTTGTAVNVLATALSRLVNGVTQVRFEVRFFNAATGATFEISTANIAATKELHMQVLFTI